MFLDAGGVIVLPDRGLVARALEEAGVRIEPGAVPQAHYEAVRWLDQRVGAGGYFPAFCRALGMPRPQAPDAIQALERLADRSLSGKILWSEAAPHAQRAIGALRDAGMQVFVVTNSDGHAAENLRDAGICHEGRSGSGGVAVDGVVDSALVGYAKPHPGIFRAAVERAGVPPSEVVHVGDMVSADVAGAGNAGIVPIHFDPPRRCRDPGHRHIRSLRGLPRHLVMASRVARWSVPVIPFREST